jgi:hypothetical protein
MGFDFPCMLMSGADRRRLAVFNSPLARTGPGLGIRKYK